MTPELVFIIPYRNRVEHKNFFDIFTKYLLEDYESSQYLILFVHQTDTRPFNRGAMKNIGFIYIKENYPYNYEDITFVFNDIDTLPYKKNLINYKTKPGEIKHFYGYKFALGGIVSITGKDFEKIDGFPNYWEWGFEDNVLNKRALRHNININREQFYTIGSNEILHFVDSITKIIDGRNLEHEIDKKYTEVDGISTIKNLTYDYIDNENMVNVTKFQSKYDHQSDKYFKYSTLNGPRIKRKVNNNKKSLLFL